MPWHSQQSLDVFCEAALYVAYVTLHTGPTPALDNAFDSNIAPGYTPRALTFASNDRGSPPRTQQDAEIPFGPATREWPQIQSISVRWGTPTVVASLIATVPLEPETRITVPQDES